MTAARIYSLLSGGVVSDAEATRRLQTSFEELPKRAPVPQEHALMLIEGVLDVMLADGVLKASEIQLLRRVATTLGLPPEAADLAVARRHAGNPGNTHRESRRSRMSNDLDRAASILGVSRDAPFADVTKAWRAAITTHHPDRVTGDSSLKSEAEARAKEINWAYDLLKRNAAAAA